MSRIASIRSISHAVDIVRALRSDPFVTTGRWRLHRFPFGIWFRGQSRRGLPLIPRVHRTERVLHGREQLGAWDETNLFEHLRVRVPSHQRTYRSAFEWLCLMQHYSVPTRLLDWSESLLPALYFAVRDDPDDAGELIVLNARRLNRDVKDRPTLSPPDEGPVVVRAEMAWTRIASKLRRKKTVVAALDEIGVPAAEPGNTWIEPFLTPLAVFPNRLNDRMVFQSSVFTLHGGKTYPKGMARHYAPDTIPAPVTIDELNGRERQQPLLKRFSISPRAKRQIVRDLFLLGIHEGTLFPEVDRQAVYLDNLWWYPEHNG